MLKKMLRNCCLTLIMLISIGILSACCSLESFTASVIFDGVDPNMGVSDYEIEYKFGEGLDVEFVIPEGYSHSGLSATLNGRPFDIEVVLADDGLTAEYDYATEKTVKMHIRKLVNDAEIKFDMSQVRKKQFEISIDKKLLSTVETNEFTHYSTNLRALVVDEGIVGSLRQLNQSDILEEISFESSTLTVDYGKTIILGYNIVNKKNEVETMYSTPGYFTEEDRIEEYSAIKYVAHNVARLGNNHYNVNYDNNLDGSTRLYYLGKIQEDITLFDHIPSYEAEKGFVLENNENKFSLLTNMQDYNSSLLSINVYQPSNTSYDYYNNNIDKIGNQIIEKVNKYNASGDLKNSSLIYNIYNRYDVYNMYIGDDIDNDPLLTTIEKSVLTDELYVSIGSAAGVENLKIKLLTYEKQGTSVPSVTISNFTTSEKGEVFFKLDKAIVEKFLLDRGARGENNEIISYQTGNAILYVEIASYIEKCRLNGTNTYTAINYPIILPTTDYAYNDYRVEIFLVDDRGNKDYGFIDYNRVGISEDYVYFSNDGLWNSDRTFKNNVYMSVYGPKYSGYSRPVMDGFSIYLNDPRHSVIPIFVEVEDPKVLNGVELYKLNLAGVTGIANANYQYRVDVEISLTQKIGSAYSLNFSELELGMSEKVFVTNNGKFDSFDDFEEISNANLNTQATFGLETDLFYFVVSHFNLDFDICLRAYDNSTGQYDTNLQLASSTRKLLDIAGNEVKVEYKGKEYNVYVKYQTNNIYENIGSTYWAYKK